MPLRLPFCKHVGSPSCLKYGSIEWGNWSIGPMVVMSQLNIIKKDILYK